jgi:hypothetical protein
MAALGSCDHVAPLIAGHQRGSLRRHADHDAVCSTSTPLVAGLALAGVAFSLITHWAGSPAWQDSSRLALIFGALIASMLAGFLIFQLGGALPIDVVGKLVLYDTKTGERRGQTKPIFTFSSQSLGWLLEPRARSRARAGDLERIPASESHGRSVTPTEPGEPADREYLEKSCCLNNSPLSPQISQCLQT